MTPQRRSPQRRFLKTPPCLGASVRNFPFFRVPVIYQHKILFWGIFGALVMRAFMIAAGAALLTNFAWITYVFAAILCFTGVKMFIGTDEAVDFEKNITLRLLRKVMPLTKEFHGDKFFVRQGVKWAATPMFAVLICVEFTTFIFAATEGSGIPSAFCWSRSRADPAANFQPSSGGSAV